MSQTLAPTRLITAAEFLVAKDLPESCELIDGKVNEMNRPSRTHGKLCNRIATILTRHSDTHQCGEVVINDAGIQTKGDPDTVRGADIAYYSYNRIPKGTMKDDYSGPAPEVVFEVLSKSDLWSRTLVKIGEYLGIDVLVVCVVDPEQRTARLFRGDGTDVTLTEDEVLEIPEIQPTFQVKVSELFA